MVPQSAASARTHLVTSLYELDSHLLTSAFVQSQLHKAESTSVQISYLDMKTACYKERAMRSHQYILISWWMTAYVSVASID